MREGSKKPSILKTSFVNGPLSGPRGLQRASKCAAYFIIITLPNLRILLFPFPLEAPLKSVPSSALLFQHPPQKKLKAASISTQMDFGHLFSHLLMPANLIQSSLKLQHSVSWITLPTWSKLLSSSLARK